MDIPFFFYTSLSMTLTVFVLSFLTFGNSSKEWQKQLQSLTMGLSLCSLVILLVWVMVFIYKGLATM